jgi:hypothetical protein
MGLSEIVICVLSTVLTVSIFVILYWIRRYRFLKFKYNVLVKQFDVVVQSIIKHNKVNNR